MSAVIVGDCVSTMRGMEAGSVDAIVTDPPYGLGFMGKEWDALPPGREWAEECLRVLRPGGHLLAFGGTRTYHRLACAIEDAGFEIRDCLAWLYGSGFPKSHDVSKAIDKQAGAEREVVGRFPSFRPNAHADTKYAGNLHTNGNVTAPATPDAETWAGWGTALKPAHEPVVMARKPLVGTVAANVLEHGTGAVNVDGCRIATDDDLNGGAYSDERRASESEWVKNGGTIHSSTGEAFVQPSGRWPANVLLDDDAAALLDEQTGELVSGANPTRRSADAMRGSYGGFGGQDGCEAPRGVDRGGASRFFYVAKASAGERSAGLADRNVHPTVKPIELMRWLVRLVTPAGGLVLDPFTGSGTTGCACVLEGFEFVGVEREPEYAAIAEARIAYWTPTQGVLL